MTPSAAASRRVVVTRFGGPEVISLLNGPPPEPGAGEVRVRIEASGAGATDTVIRKGVYPLIKDKPPFTLGYEFIGRIDAVGPGGDDSLLDRRVADIVQIGGNSDHIIRPSDDLVFVPDELPAENAVCLPLAYMTAYQMLTHGAGVEAGQHIFVQGGSGAVGTALLQLARTMGISAVATASAAKLDHVRAQGAEAVDYRGGTAHQNLRDLARRGFDAAFDAIGPASFRRSFALLSPGGRLVTYGTMAVARTIERKTISSFLRFGLSFGAMMAGNALRSATGGGRTASFFGIVDSRTGRPDRYRADLAYLFDLVAQSRLAPATYPLPLDRVIDAHRLLDGGGSTGQIVLVN